MASVAPHSIMTKSRFFQFKKCQSRLLVSAVTNHPLRLASSSSSSFPFQTSTSSSTFSPITPASRPFARSLSTSRIMSSSSSNEAFKSNKLFDVQDKVVVISGGGSGIGLMCTQAFAVNGAKVYIIGRTKSKLDAVVSEYGKNISGQIIPLQGDVSSKAEIQRLYEEIKAKEKCVCVLINNAGIAGPTFQTEAQTAEEMSNNLFHAKDATFEDWVDTYRTNVPQIYFMTTAFLPLLQKASEHQHGYSGCVINISSISGIVKSSQHHPAYNASKAAAIHITKMLSAEIASNGLQIRVNTLAPGVYPSEMTTSESDDKQKSHIEKEKFEGKVPANRPGTELDMANGVLFMATNQYLNGQCVAIDGGYIIQHGSA